MEHKPQPGFFDLSERSNKLTQMGDRLIGLNGQIDWEAFRPDLSLVHDKARKSNAGAKPIDVILMFKVLVLQQLHNLSDDRIEYQIRDRLSFMRFLGLQLEDRVPDAKTVALGHPVWLFRERLKELKRVGHCALYGYDGLYRSGEGAPVFHEVRAPTVAELQALLAKIITRILKGLTRQGHLI